jgi:cytochrome P450
MVALAEWVAAKLRARGVQSGRNLPPRMRGNPIVDLLRNPPRHAQRCARELGDVSDLGLVGTRVVLLAHPDHVEALLVRDNKLFVKDRGTHDLSRVLGNGLLTSEGDFWRRQRRLAQPAFHRERIAAYGHVMVEHAERAASRWAQGASIDLHRELMRLTLEIVGRTLFGADVADDASHVGEAMEAVSAHFETVRPGFPAVLELVPTEQNRRFRRALRELDRVIVRIVEEHRGRDADDLLGMLMAARDDDGSGMSPKQLRDEAMTLFLAGHETTALALSWTFYLLARRPEARDRLEAELASVLAGRTPTVEDLPKLEVTDAIVNEAMRLYPPAWAVGREATVDWSIGGFDIPKETQLWASPFVMHRDPRFWDEPERFLPERWRGGLAKRLPRYAFFPFGGGPRLCIGNAFALMEAKLLLATIAQRRRFALRSSREIAAGAAVTLRPRGGVPVVVEAR